MARDQSDRDTTHEEPLFEDEPALFVYWWRNSPSWLVSMAFHFVLLVILAVCAVGSSRDDERVVKVYTAEPPTPMSEPPQPLIQPQPSDVPRPPVETAETAEVDEPAEPLEDSPPDVSPANDPSRSAPARPEITTALASIPVGDRPSAIGNAATGFGNRLSGPGIGHALRKGDAPPGTLTSTGGGNDWFLRHQNRDGSWSFNHTPGDRCSGFPNPGEKTSRMGATGLVLMALLGRGFTHEDRHSSDERKRPYGKAIFRGLTYLLKHMHVEEGTGRLFEEDGDAHSHMYCHGIAACALAEAYGMTRDRRLRNPAELALNYIAAAQHADGGWRYGPNEPGDTSVLGWQIMAFKSGKMSYLTVPEIVYPRAGKFLDSVARDGGAAYAYMPAEGHGETSATSAIGLLCRVYLGLPERDEAFCRGVAILAERGPHPRNMYYNYYATMLMFQVGGPRWRTWMGEMSRQLLRTQERAGGPHLAGSWHFAGEGLEDGLGDVGGRLYNTALAVMTLESYYRYDQVYGRKLVCD